MSLWNFILGENRNDPAYLRKPKVDTPVNESEVRAAQLRFYRVWTLIGFVVLVSFALYFPVSAIQTQVEESSNTFQKLADQIN